LGDWPIPLEPKRIGANLGLGTNVSDHQIVERPKCPAGMDFTPTGPQDYSKRRWSGTG